MSIHRRDHPYTKDSCASGISVIIPCLNERHNLGALVRVIQTAGTRYSGAYEIIVVDGGSQDGCLDEIQLDARIRIIGTSPSRAIQMNFGARHARYNTLYFVHADTRPPLNCLAEVCAARGKGMVLGGYAFQFDSQRTILRFNSYLTKFNVVATRGGDQSMFICRDLFQKLNGYDEAWVIMEEYDLIVRAQKSGTAYHLLKGNTLVSDRKYWNRSWLRVQLANVRAMAMWRLGYSSHIIREKYHYMLNFGTSHDG